jgi:hypothetical protein
MDEATWESKDDVLEALGVRLGAAISGGTLTGS